MEPMTLGSPTHSHSHHNVQTSHSGQFLPGYLMGDPMPSVSPSSSRVWSRSTSPTKSMTPSNIGARDSVRIDRTDSRTQRASVSHTPKAKDGAPPVAGLFDNVEALKGSPAIGMGTSYVGTPERNQLDFSQHGIPSPLPRTSLHMTGYLMGDPMPSVSPSSSRVWSRSTSPTKSMTPSNIGARDSVRIDRTDSRTQRASVSHTPKAKDGAPPVAGLFDNVEALKGSPAIGMGTSYVGTPERNQLDFSQHGIPSPLPRTSLHMTGTPGGNKLFSPPNHQTSQIQFGHCQSASSPAQIDPFYTQGEAITTEDQLDETWVTVFGFPPAATSFILQQFSQYGNIVKHVVASSGNWMHLQYSSKIQAKKALSKNGKVLGNSIMIGVRSCIDKSVIDGREGDATTSFVSSPQVATPHKSFSMRTASTGSQDSDTQRNNPIRPLTAAYKAASSNHEVLQDGNTPQKSSNMISKSLEYMFGW